MKNPFVLMALAASAFVASLQNNAIANYNAGVRSEHPGASIRKTGQTVAQAKRAAIKAKNRAKHRANCRG